MIEKTPYKENLIIFRRPRRISPGLAVVLTLIIVVLVYWGARYFRGQINPYEHYVRRVNEVVQKSNNLAEEFEALKVDVYSVTREELTEKLAKIKRDSLKLAAEVKEIEEPRKMEAAQAYLILTFELRAKGLDAYERAVAEGIAQLDLNAASQPIAVALREIVFSDKSYSYFRAEAGRVLKEKGIKSPLLTSSFLSKESEAEKEKIIIYLQQLKGLKIQEALHGIGIISLSTQPRKIRYDKERGVYILSKADMFNATIEVINQGNVAELNVPVVAILKTKNGKEQRREQYITSIKQNERKPVTFQNFLPASRGINFLTITVGPLPNEQYTKNNTREFKFVME